MLEIGPEAKVVSRDKAEDILNPPSGGGGAGASGNPIVAASTASGFLSVSLGTIDAQTLNNSGATHSAGEPNHCGVLGGASRWMGLRAAGDGTLIIDTIGSTMDTVLAVYGEPASVATLYSELVACDNNGASDGIRSRVRFNSQAGKGYLAVVDGVNKTEGTIQINWKLGIPPVPGSAPPVISTPPVGGTVALRVTATNGVPPPVYQWFFNQQRIAGATNVTLVLANLQSSQSGVYTVMSGNFAGTTIETNAVVMVGMDVPFSLGNGAATTNGFGFWVSGSTGQTFVVQATTNLVPGTQTNWMLLLTGQMTNSPVYILDTNAARYRQRWYRTVTP